MRLSVFLLSGMIASAAVSCNENAPPDSQAHAPLAAAPAPKSEGSAPAAAAPQFESPIAPPGAQWTIECDTTEGPAHVAQAGILKERLVQATGLRDWYVIHGDRKSTVYYGYYRSLTDPAEKRRAEADRARIAKLTDSLGNRMVRGDILVPINAPDPTAPAEWNLLNTPADAYWTIEIETFSGNPLRKEAAVEVVRALRERGEKDAYYYHGPSASSVCIGAWRRDAVAEQGTGIDHGGAMRDDAHTQSADQPLLVLSDVAPPNMPGRVFEPGTGRPMTVESLKLEILDPDMKAKVAMFPNHMVNNELKGTVSHGQTFPDPSVLVVIPHGQAAISDNDWQLTGGAPAARSSDSPAPVAPPGAAPTSPGDNVLRSIGDH